MKKRNLTFKKFNRIICNTLILMAPFIISKSACVLYWGEPDCPDCLKVLTEK